MTYGRPVLHRVATCQGGVRPAWVRASVLSQRAARCQPSTVHYLAVKSPPDIYEGRHPEDVPAYAFSEAAALTGVPPIKSSPANGDERKIP